MTELDYQLCCSFHSSIRMQQYTLVVPFINGKAEIRFGWGSCSFILNTLLFLGRGFLHQLEKPVDKDKVCSFLGLTLVCISNAKQNKIQPSKVASPEVTSISRKLLQHQNNGKDGLTHNLLFLPSKYLETFSIRTATR